MSRALVLVLAAALACVAATDEAAGQSPRRARRPGPRTIVWADRPEGVPLATEAEQVARMTRVEAWRRRGLVRDYEARDVLRAFPSLQVTREFEALPRASRVEIAGVVFRYAYRIPEAYPLARFSPGYTLTLKRVAGGHNWEFDADRGGRLLDD